MAGLLAPLDALSCPVFGAIASWFLWYILIVTKCTKILMYDTIQYNITFYIKHINYMPNSKIAIMYLFTIYKWFKRNDVVFILLSS